MAALCARVAAEAPEIQVCCPRGHFIVALWLGPGVGPIGPLMMWPAVGRDHRIDKRAVLIDPTPVQLDQLDAGNPGFTVAETPQGQGLAVALSCPRCPRWKPVHDYQRLAAELAAYALAGHQKHRLAS